jgi:pimeloyl-ACP methyl ester carboxylesterase
MEIRKANCNVMMLSYRGYGESKGNPSEKGIIRDAEAAVLHLLQRSDIDPKKLILYGQALGGAVAIAVAEKYPLHVSIILFFNTFIDLWLNCRKYVYKF